MKKIPYGIINYKKLVEEYEYVDKTMYLEKLEDVAKKFVDILTKDNIIDKVYE